MINHKRHHLCGLHPLPTASPVGSSHILQSSTEITAYKVHENHWKSGVYRDAVLVEGASQMSGFRLRMLSHEPLELIPAMQTQATQPYTIWNPLRTEMHTWEFRLASPSYMELHPKTGHWQILQLSKWLPLKFWPTRPSFHGNSRASPQNVVSHIDTTRLWDITLPRCWRLQSFEVKCSREKHDQKKVLCS